MCGVPKQGTILFAITITVAFPERETIISADVVNYLQCDLM